MRKISSLPAFSFLLVALILGSSIVCLAQSRDKFVISAKAGGINAITGQASVYSRGDADWQQLMITDDLSNGDRVRTSFDGRVEILLNPGSYLRVGANSEVELLDNSLANLEVRLIRGTAIVEATGLDGLELNINISTPHTKLAIVRQGLYRLNVVPGDATELIVRKGHVILSDSSHTKVKGGNKVVFNAVNVSVAKLTKDEKKALDKQDVDAWSKERAETLAKANRRITDRMLSSAFASANDPFGWRNGRLGLWFYNSHAGCYTFLPYFYGFGSPYGRSYSTSVYYHPPANGYNNGSNGSGSNAGSRPYPSGGGSGSGGSTGGGGNNRPSPPPSYGNEGGNRPSPPPRIDTDGMRMPRKNLERLPNQN